MPIKYRPNQVVGGRYRIESEVNTGEFAISYKAVRVADNCPVFFKQYSKPTILVPWYKAYLKQVHALRGRISSNPHTRAVCYEFYDIFESKPNICMAFEWADGGLDLAGKLRQPKLSWEERVSYSMVMLYGVRMLHEVKIVHADLKPENLLLVPDKCALGFRLKIIDMDQSFLSDSRAAWHGSEAYAGTPSYYSPEHAGGRDAYPTEASDAFTCGIILAQVIGDGSPFPDDEDGYRRAIQHRPPRRVRLRGDFGDKARNRIVEDIINAALEASAARRPTVAQLHQALGQALTGRSGPTVVADGRSAILGRLSHADIPPVPPNVATPSSPDSSGTAASPSSSPPPSQATNEAGVAVVELRSGLSSGARPLVIKTDMEVGAALLLHMGPEYSFMSSPQFRIFRVGGRWMVEPFPAATNATLLDGRRIEAAVPLLDGQELAVGSRDPSKNIKKAPLTVRLING
jgi:serine/threonine protein kinase